MVRHAAGLKPDHPYVERRPGVQGGRPVIRGSRFPVRSIVQAYRGGLSVEEILRQFPQLTPAEVHDALSYAHDHQAEIDEEIRLMEDMEGTMREFPPTVLPRGDGGGQDLPG
jgi:uncharacterized protein (DUF433 family)